MAKEQGLFDVHSMLRVARDANGTYRCLVLNVVDRHDPRKPHGLLLFGFQWHLKGKVIVLSITPEIEGS